MSDRPKPHWDDEWHWSISEDYARAPDDVRRRILLSQGYDKAHESEVARLFPADESEQLVEELKPNHNKDRSKLEKLKRIASFVVAVVAFIGVIFGIISDFPGVVDFFQDICRYFYDNP